MKASQRKPTEKKQMTKRIKLTGNSLSEEWEGRKKKQAKK